MSTGILIAMQGHIFRDGVCRNCEQTIAAHGAIQDSLWCPNDPEIERLRQQIAATMKPLMDAAKASARVPDRSLRVGRAKADDQQCQLSPIEKANALASLALRSRESARESRACGVLIDTLLEAERAIILWNVDRFRGTLADDQEFRKAQARRDMARAALESAIEMMARDSIPAHFITQYKERVDGFPNLPKDK